jgi:hypothetical protein
MTKRQKIFYRIGQTAGLILVFAWFCWGGIEMKYIHWPRVPDPETGRTIPHQTKGITAYIAKSEHEFQRRLVYVTIVSGAVMLVCLFASGEFRRLMNPGPKPPQSN